MLADLRSTWQLPLSGVSSWDIRVTHDVPLYQYEASVLAVHSSFPAYKFDDVDILTSHDVLGKLFNWLSGETEDDFDFFLFLVGRTMIIEDRSVRFGASGNMNLTPQRERVVHPDKTRPQDRWDKHRHRTFTTFPDSAEKYARGHFRVLRYNIGPLMCVVRCHVEAALESPQQEHTEVDEPMSTRGHVLMRNNPYVQHCLPRIICNSTGGRRVTVQGATRANISALKCTKIQARKARKQKPRLDAQPGEQFSSQDRGTGDLVATHTENGNYNKSRLSERQVVGVLMENVSNTDETTMQPNMASLYFSRTFHLEHVGYIDDGVVESISSRDIFRVLRHWEEKGKTQEALRKLTSLLCHFYKCCWERHTDAGDLGPLIARLGRSQAGGREAMFALRMVSPPRGFLSPALPEHIVKMMWTEAALRPG